MSFRKVLLGHAFACVIASGAALAQSPISPPFTCSSGNNCQVPAGSYTTQALQVMQDAANYTVTNNGTFTIPLPAVPLSWTLQGANGADSNDNHDAPGAGGNSGSLTFINAGSITQTGSGGSQGFGFDAIFVKTQGGNGGSYLPTNADQNGASPGSTGSITFTNNAAVSVTGPFTVTGTSIVLAISQGGQGGNVASEGPDENGNPTYHTSNGTPGGSAGAVTVTNNATITVSNLSISQALWVLSANSQGGNGGTGNDGQAGGNGGAVTMTNNALIQATPQWVSGSSPTGAFALYALSQGGNGNMSVNSGNNGGQGGYGNDVTVTLNQGGSVTLDASSTPSGFTAAPSAAIGAYSTGGTGGAGYDSAHGGFGGGTGHIVLSATGATITASGPQAYGIIAQLQGGTGGNGGIGQDNSNGGDGGSTGRALDGNTADKAVSVTLSGATVVTVNGVGGAGVLAQSQGGRGGAGTNYDKFGVDSSGGIGGDGGADQQPVQQHRSISWHRGVIAGRGWWRWRRVVGRAWWRRQQRWCRRQRLQCHGHRQRRRQRDNQRRPGHRYLRSQPGR